MSFDVVGACSCVRELQSKCGFLLIAPRREPDSYVSYILDDPDFGRMAYTISILLMFSLMESLLEAMRFREELDLQERQRRRLMKAKTKQRRTTSSTISEIPRVVVTAAGDAVVEDRSRTPCISLMYDFTEEPNDVDQMMSCRCSVSLDMDQIQPLTAPLFGVQGHSLSLET
ncbi:unnamed protein product [Nippostrongylus brasiliensis]|uniref:UBX domain-containing protein n=1 Tax=Nippostrongylus brasiliensis TaxID=27835 RepID=A0A0N4YBG7_NIPBR|nr:unnamed protein product [Nippostrongylus brasiliensis]